MPPLSRTLLRGLGGIAASLALLLCITSAVDYRPWGVHESQLQHYDELVAKIDQKKQLKQTIKHTARPICTVDDPFANFGYLHPGKVATRQVQIRNRGSERLEIEIASKPKSTITAQLSSRIVPPKQTATLTLSWNVGAELERESDHLTLRTNDELNQFVEIQMAGKLSDPAVCPEAVSFGRMDAFSDVETEFIVYSQRWKELVVEDATANLQVLHWTAEPLSPNEFVGANPSALTAQRIRVWTQSPGHGEINSELKVTLSSPASPTEKIHRTIGLQGKVKPAITFNSPLLDRRSGLDFGIVSTNQEKSLHISVRVRNADGRKIEVLDVKPASLKASLAAARNGTHRLTLNIPKGSKPEVFNLTSHQGYVSVGDPNDTTFSSWFPIQGAIVQLH